MDKDNEAPSLRDSIEASYDADVAKPDSTPVESVRPAAPATPATNIKPTAPGVVPGADTAKPANDPVAKSADGKVPAVDGQAPAVKQIKMPPGYPDVNEWNALPDQSKGWIKQREAQFGEHFKKNAAFAQFGNQMAEAVKPYEWMLQAKGVPPAQVVKEVMAFNATMTTGSAQEKQQMLLRAAKHYGVDLNAMPPSEGQQAPAPTKELLALQQQVAQMAGYLRGKVTNEAQHEARQAWSAVQTMGDDKASYPHLDVVSNDMADLLERGMAQSAHDAYQKAVWMRQDTRALLTSQEAAKRAEVARAAAGESTSYGGHAVAGSTKPQSGTLRQALNDAWDRAA